MWPTGRFVVLVAQAKEPVTVPRGARDGAGDAGEAAMMASIPEEAVARDGDLMRHALPLPHQYGPGAGQGADGQGVPRGPFPRRAFAEHALHQSGQFLRNGFRETAIAAFLARIR